MSSDSVDLASYGGFPFENKRFVVGRTAQITWKSVAAMMVPGWT